MYRRFAAAVVLLVVCGAVLVAEEIRCQFLEYKDGKVKVLVRKKGEKEGEEKTFDVVKDCKLFQSKYDFKTKTIEKGDEIKEGFKSDKLEAKKTNLLLKVEGGKVEEAHIIQGRRKPKDN
jgi:hypothetical protein